MAAAAAVIERFNWQHDDARTSSPLGGVIRLKTGERKYLLERCWGPGRTVETLTVQLDDGRLQSAVFREETVPEPGCCGNETCPDLLVTPSSSSSSVRVSFEPVADALAGVGLCGTHMSDPCILAATQEVAASTGDEHAVDLSGGTRVEVSLAQEGDAAQDRPGQVPVCRYDPELESLVCEEWVDIDTLPEIDQPELNCLYGTYWDGSRYRCRPHCAWEHVEPIGLMSICRKASDHQSAKPDSAAGSNGS